MSKWKPIETAPQEGFFLAAGNVTGHPDDWVMCVVWREGNSFYTDWTYENYALEMAPRPTHWTELPPAPNTDS